MSVVPKRLEFEISGKVVRRNLKNHAMCLFIQNIHKKLYFTDEYQNHEFTIIDRLYTVVNNQRKKSLLLHEFLTIFAHISQALPSLSSFFQPVDRFPL